MGAVLSKDVPTVRDARVHHVYIRCNVPPGTREVKVGGDIDLDLIHDTRNVWETKDRHFDGELQRMEWSELKTYLTLPSAQPTVKYGTVSLPYRTQP
eukprot:SAG25_NODE_6728_length_534_cov_5.314943_1_plen_97_part_00